MLNTVFRRLLRSLSFRTRAGRSHRHAPRPSFKPVVECLEDRSVPATLTLSIPTTSMSEAAGPNAVGALLNRTGDLSQPLTVNLTSSDTTEATVPATVSFAAGQQEVGFSISAVDDAILDGTQTVTITATANVTQGQQPFGLDSSYGVGGLAPTRMNMNIQPPAAAITIQRDGKAIVASESGSTTHGWTVQRFNTDGSLDTTFGGGLVTTTDLGGGFPVPFKAVVLPDGDILIGGKVSQGTGAGILVRYNSNGTLDTAFGVGGKANLAALNNSLASAWVTDIALRPDGRILLGLGINGNVTTRVAQLNANGTFDSTFGVSGISNLNLGFAAEQVEILSDGTFLVGGSFQAPVRVAKVQRNGVVLVTSFGTNGIASLNFGRQSSQVVGMEVDAQGRIVIGGTVSDFTTGSPPADYAVGRLNPNGTPDTSFAGDGTAVIDAGGREVATALVLQQDGKVIVGGHTTPVPTGNRDSSMVRFTASGAADTTFDGDGVFRQSLTTTFTTDQIMNMAIQDDGKLLALAGWANDQRIARFHLGPQQFTLSSSDTIDVLDNEVGNRPPVAQLFQHGTPEDTPLNNVLHATDPDGDPLTYTIVSQPSQGSVQITNASTGAFTFTPALNFTGTVSFTFKVNDGQVDSNTAPVFVTVTPVNDAPVAQDRSFTINEDPASPFLQGTLLATDVDSATLTYSIVTQPTNGVILSFNAATGAFTYRPGPNFNGTDTFTYRARDGSLDSNTATVTITVNPVNDAPIPSPVVQQLTTPEDTPLPGQLTANDPEGDPVTFALEAGPTNGTLTLASNGSFTFTPNANFSGVAEFVYRASDPSGAFNFGGVRITITPVNDAPTAVNDTFTVAEDGVLSISASPVTRLRMVSEPGDFIGQGLTYDFTPLNAVFDVDTNFDNGVSLDVDPPAPGEFWFLDFAAPNEVLLTPGTYLDAQRFPFQATGRPGLDVSGNGRGSNTLTGRFTVFDVIRNATQDDILSFAAGFEQHSEGNQPALIGWIMFNSTFGADGGVLANDTDVESDLLLGASLVSGPSNGTLTFKGDGTFSYTPNANFHGTDSFTYRSNDGRADSNVATVTINVTPVNDAPVANGGSFSTAEDTPLNGAVSATDVDNNPLTYSVVTQDLHGGSLSLNSATGAFTFSPAADYNGPASFTYKVNDGTVDSNVATVTVNVTPVNDAPVANALSVTTDEDTPVSGTMTATDVDSPTLTFTVVAQPTRGTLNFNPNTGAFIFTPVANFNGPDSFTFKASDGTADSNVATVSITVNAVNDAPVASNATVTTNEDTPVSGTMTAADVDSPTLTFTVVAQPTRGTLNFNPNTGAFTYTPNADSNGSDSFTFRASDGSLSSNTATVSLSVTAVNDAPVTQGQSQTTAEDTPLTGQVIATDVDSTSLTYSVVNAPTHGSLTLNANGSFTYTPAANYNGSDSFTFRATDGSLVSNTATVAFTVTAVNDAPVTVADSYSTQVNTTLTVTATNGVLRNDTDFEGNPLTAVLTAGPSHGTLTLNADGSFTYRAAAGYFGSDSFTYRARDASGALGNVATVTLTISGRLQVGIDIDTGDKSNTLNLHTKKVKVAILSTADFNAPKEVDIGSLTFGRTGSEDSLVYKKKGRLVYEIRDVNHDGRLDLVVSFDIDDTDLRVGDTSATLFGTLRDGTPIFGTGSVRLKRGGGCHD